MVSKVPELLTIYEVAEVLRVSYETALLYAKQNNLTIKVGRQYRVPAEKLAAHLSKASSPTATPLKLKKGR